MKHLLIATACAATLAGCMSDAPTAIKPTGSAVDPFVGKSLVGEDGTTFDFMANGTITGIFRGSDPIAGTYTSTAREVCSTYTSPDQLTGGEYCSTPQINGSNVIFNRRDGSQSATYVIQ